MVKAVTGEVLVRCFYKGPRVSMSRAISSRGASITPRTSYEPEADNEALQAVPVLHWLQEQAWLVYVVLLMASVIYRFMFSGDFSGDPIALRPGAPMSSNVAKRSTTHYLTLQKDGNLVLREGTPGDPTPSAPVWESGKPFANKDCVKCVFMLDGDGETLIVKNGRKTVMSFSLSQEKLLGAAIKRG